VKMNLPTIRWFLLPFLLIGVMKSFEFSRVIELPSLIELQEVISDNADPKPDALIQLSPWDLVMAVAWSPDGDILAFSAGAWVHFYSYPDLVEINSEYIGSFSHSIAFNADGSYVAAGSRDGYIRVWSIQIPGILEDKVLLERSFLAHPKGVNSVNFNSSGDLLASGGNDAVARLWDIRSGERVNEIIGGTFAIPSVLFAPSPGDLAVDPTISESLAIINGGILRLRDPDSGRFIGTIRADQPFYSMAYKNSPPLLVTGNIENKVQIWDPSQVFRTGSDQYPTPLAEFSHNGKPASPASLVWAVTFDPLANLIASAGGDGSIIIWDVKSGESTNLLAAHSGGATSLAFSPDGKKLASGGLDATVKIWEIER